jgi:hypothetical protein
MVVAVVGAIFFSSSSSTTTYLPLLVSYPLTMSDRSMGLFCGAVPDFLDARHILLVQHVEVNRFRPHSGKQPHGKGNEPKADNAFPDWWRASSALLLVAAVVLALGRNGLSLAPPAGGEGFADADLALRDLALFVPARIALIAFVRLDDFP